LSLHDAQPLVPAWWPISYGATRASVRYAARALLQQSWTLV